MTRRAVRVLRILVMLRTGRLNRANIMRHAVAGQTKLVDRTKAQQPGIGGSVRRVAGRTSFGLERRMFKSEWTLLVGVTLDAGRVGAGGQSRLLEFKTTVRVMAIAALHRPFQNLVMKRHVELRLHLAVATQAKLRLAGFQQMQRREGRLLRISLRHECYRTRQVSAGQSLVRRVAVRAANIVAPMLATPEVVVLLLARMTRETGLCNVF